MQDGNNYVNAVDIIVGNNLGFGKSFSNGVLLAIHLIMLLTMPLALLWSLIKISWLQNVCYPLQVINRV